MKGSQDEARIEEATRHIKEKAQTAGAALQALISRETADEVRDVLHVRDRVEGNPYGMVAAALGVGYVLGGGLFSPVTRFVLGAGLRIGLGATVLPLLNGYLGLGVTEPRKASAGISAAAARTSDFSTTKKKEKQT